MPIYKYALDARTIVNQGKAVLANRNTGGWIRISEEVFNILEEYIDSNTIFDNWLANKFDKEDESFIKELCNILLEKKIFVIDSENQIIKSRLISFEMTRRCNLKCTHCCIDSKNILDDAEDLSTDITKGILDKMIVWNPQTIMLSGGEPMIRNDFMELLAYLRKNYHGNIIISTNGTLIDSQNVEKLVLFADKLEISIDGVDEESCSKIRGKGIYKKVIESISLLKGYNYHNIGLSMVFGNVNSHLKEDFLKLNEQLGTKPLMRGFSPVGRGKENQFLFSDLPEGEVYVPEDYLSKSYNKSYGISPCSAGKRELFIDYTGDIYPCPAYMSPQFMLGNVTTIDLIDDIIKKTDSMDQQKNIIKLLQPENIEPCKDCKVNLFCWTCPGEYEEYRGNEKLLQSRCRQIKELLHYRVWER